MEDLTADFTRDGFCTIEAPVKAEITIRKSNFIAYAAPCCDEAASLEFISRIKKKHHDATHNVYAFSVGGENPLQRSSDDGEPAGTAGRPILEVIKGSGLNDVAVVVTRYFGGVLLGTGGLVRAYSLAAQQSLAAAKVVTVIPACKNMVLAPYSYLKQIQQLLAEYDGKTEDVLYAEQVSLVCLLPWASQPFFLEALRPLQAFGISVITLPEAASLRRQVNLTD